jgi:hypothetical protein
VKGSNFDAKKNTFVDRFAESNANGILHTLEASTTVYRNAEWHAGLRGDRRERKDMKLKDSNSKKNSLRVTPKY